MKLELHLHNKIHSVESDDHPDITEMAELFKGLLVSAGFHPQSVDNLFELDSQWFTEEEQNLCKAWKDMKVQEYQDSLYKNEINDIDLNKLEQNKIDFDEVE